jgi:hypothetical protein
MPPDKIEPDLLSFLGLREKEILGKLAEMDGRTELEELKWLIRSRAFGRLKDLGDDRVSPQVFEADLSEYLEVKSLRIERVDDGAGDRHPTPRNDRPVR